MDDGPEIEEYLQWKSGKQDISSDWEKNTKSLLHRFVAILKKPVLDASTKDILLAFKVIRESKQYKPNYKRTVNQRCQSILNLDLGKRIRKLDTVDIRSVKLPEPQWKTKKPRGYVDCGGGYNGYPFCQECP